jgi:RNA polymerase-binding transcription factor DksA
MLLRMKEDSIKQIRYLRESMGTDSSDELNAMFIQRELRVIASLEFALMRIEEGTYGSCRSCGGSIERGRLEALPHTQVCLSCKGG